MRGTCHHTYNIHFCSINHISIYEYINKKQHSAGCTQRLKPYQFSKVMTDKNAGHILKISVKCDREAGSDTDFNK